MAQTTKRPESDDRRPAVVTVPRAWLILLTTLVVLPWLVLGAWYAWADELPWRANRAAGVGDEGAAGTTAVAEDPGPWGRLLSTPIVISPPLEYVSTEWGPPGPPVWYFPRQTAAQAHALLVQAGMPADMAARLQSTARPEPQIAGVAVQPDAAVIDGLSPEVRTRVYGLMAATRANYPQLHPFRFEGPSAEAWFRGSPVSTASRAVVEPLLYRDGDFLFFADLARVRQQISDENELRRLMKALYRQPTMLVKLSVPAASDVDALAAYWGRGGRRTDLRPLLESIAGAGDEHAIDVAHLLPAFARDHLYRYPQVSPEDLGRPIIANCLWTALNFFSVEPEDRFLDVPYALARLRQDYHVIQHGLELGDIVALVDAEGDLFHVAVYIADDLVFTKNGTTPMAPWTLMTITSLKGYYGVLVPQPRLIYHRRNTL